MSGIWIRILTTSQEKAVRHADPLLQQSSALNASSLLCATQHGQNDPRRLESLRQDRCVSELGWITAALGTEQIINHPLTWGVSACVQDESICVRNWNPGKGRSREGLWHPKGKLNFPEENTPETPGYLSSLKKWTWRSVVFPLRRSSPWSSFLPQWSLLLPLTHHFRCLSQLLMLRCRKLSLIGALHS